jgi:hypothetical protein
MKRSSCQNPNVQVHGDVAIDNMDITNDRTMCCYRSGVRRGCACSVASEHGIVVRYGLDDRKCMSGDGSAVQCSSRRQQCDCSSVT